eukprot:14568910-Alexandrium_andersonii.AAC.1
MVVQRIYKVGDSKFVARPGLKPRCVGSKVVLGVRCMPNECLLNVPSLFRRVLSNETGASYQDAEGQCRDRRWEAARHEARGRHCSHREGRSEADEGHEGDCLLYTSPSPRD